MYSENIRQNNQYDWICNDTNQTQSNINDNNHFAMPPKSTLLTNDVKIEIIPENDQNFVSQRICRVQMPNVHCFLY